MKTLKDILLLSADYLKQKGISQPRRQAEEIISDALKVKRLQLYLEFDRPLIEAELEICRRNLQRRAQREPSQYIKGEVDFLDCNFKVNPNVLIPRQETEILVDKLCRQLGEIDLAEKTLWDVCCGSGCIGISIKKRFPDLKVILSDISIEALTVAKENAARNQVDVAFMEGNLLEPFQGLKADFFICNPPYISEKEFEKLEKEVRDFEPKLALVSGQSGLECYQKLAEELPLHLNKLSKVWFEIGYDQGEAISQLFSGRPWINRRIEQDYSGHDRFFFLEIE